MATFGTTSGGNTSQDTNGNFIVGSYKTLTELGQADSISAYIYKGAGANAKIKFALYDSSKNFIASTEEGTAVADDNYHMITLNFAAPKPVLAAGDYWILIWLENTAGAVYQYCVNLTHGRNYEAKTYNGWPASVTLADHQEIDPILYCTYTPKSPCTVTTGAASDIAQTTATLNGSLDTMGDETSVDVTFQYGETDAYGTETPGSTETAIGDISEGITGLTASTGYYFRIKAVGTYGTAYGADAEFTTLAAAVAEALKMGALIRKLGLPNPQNVGVGL